MSVIQNGRFIIGSSNDVVHQLRNKGYEVQMEQIRIWPGFEIGSVPNSLRFTWDPELGGIQGNQEIPNNADSETVYEFDPSGGTGKVGVHSIETSKWHRTKFRCIVISTNDTVENNVPTDILKVTYDENGNNIAGTVQKTETYTYSNIQEFKNNTSNGGHFADRLSNILYDGSSIFFEEGSLNGTIIVNMYDIVPYRDDDNNLPSANDTLYIHFKTEPNNNVSNRGTIMIVDKLYTMFDNEINLWNVPIPGKDDTRNEVTTLVQFFQKPNILYYVNMGWCEDPKNNYNSSPKLISSSDMEYNDSNKVLWLYIELGLSPNGGKTIYWNDTHKTSSSASDAIKKLGLSASVPNITSTMLKFEISGRDANKFVYPSIQGTYGSNPSKYVKVIYKTYVPNNEDNNTNRHQTYYVKNNNVEHSSFNSSIPSGVMFDGYNLLLSNYSVSNDDVTSDVSNIQTKFKVSRRTDTDPWFSNIKAILSIDKSNYPTFSREKYNGETA